MQCFRGAVVGAGRAAWVLCAVALAGCDAVKPELPVKLTWRDSIMGEGMVVGLHNESGGRLVLEVEITPVDGGGVKEFALSIGPHEISEIGWLQGHAFQSGDAIVVHHEKFRARSVAIP